MMKPLNQRSWVTSILIHGQLDKPWTSKALQVGGETSEQLLTCVCSHQIIPKSEARGYSPACCAWQLHIPFLDQILSSCCCPSSSLGSGTALGLPALLPNVLCAVVAALSRALFADRRNQSVIDVSGIVVSGKGRVEEGLFSWCL